MQNNVIKEITERNNEGKVIELERVVDGGEGLLGLLLHLHHRSLRGTQWI